MWNGRWSKELDTLYDIYISMFDIEPDCETDIDFDDLSYNSYVALIRKHLMLRKRIQAE